MRHHSRKDTPTLNSFHFSPRPNRAHEIQWHPWSPAAFAFAAAHDRPVLLAISAVWCHWCHVMDETTYSDPAVIEAINNGFVAIRVDNDQRPDVNARYNMGGWPTTAMLSPQGTILTGATYLPPAQMLRALQSVQAFYQGNRQSIEERATELHEERKTATQGQPGALGMEIVTSTVAAIESVYDDAYGGFGSEQKFPQTDVLEFLLLEHARTGLGRPLEMVTKTMLAMSRGGMYDHVEGGFFRYSTTRDWSVPHFEKMLEDHGGLLRTLAGLLRAGGNRDFHATARSALAYLHNTLRNQRSGLYGGSQDADESYFEQPLEARRSRSAPYIDRTIYVNWNASLASSFFSLAHALDDDDLRTEAVAMLDALDRDFLDDDGLYYHFRAEGSTEPQVRGLLTDQAAVLRASLDAHAATGEMRFLQRADALAERVHAAFGANDGGYYDHASFEAVIGALEFADRPLAESSNIADSFLRLHAITQRGEHRDRALRALQVYTQTYHRAGTFAAPYARAILRYLLPVVTVRLTGAPDEGQELRDAAHRLPDPLVTVYADEPTAEVQAFVCRESVCAAPVRSATAMRAAYDSLSGIA